MQRSGNQSKWARGFAVRIAWLVGFTLDADNSIKHDLCRMQWLIIVAHDRVKPQNVTAFVYACMHACLVYIWIIADVTLV